MLIHKHKHKHVIKTILFLLFVGVAALLLSIDRYYKERVFPNTLVAGVNLGNLTKEEAIILLSDKTKTPEKIKVSAKGNDFDLIFSEVEFSYNLDKSVNDAIDRGKSQNSLTNFVNLVKSAINKENLPLIYSYNQEKLDEYLEVISGNVSEEPVSPSISRTKNGVVVDRGKPGEVIDKNKFTQDLDSKFLNTNFDNIEISIINVDAELTNLEAEELKERAEKLAGKSIIAKNEFDNFTITESDLYTFLAKDNGFYPENISKLIETKIAPRVNREPQNAVFKFEPQVPGKPTIAEKVAEFSPSKDGLVVDKQKLSELIMENIVTLENTEPKSLSIDVPVVKSLPKISTDHVNQYGIKELIGRGTSQFKGSIPSRVFNVKLASSRISGTIIAPGETMSFNEAVGDVSSLTGYKQAYVILDGKTVLGDGGGLCQVSTTFFRAALDAGLPIVERRSHSYRVGYYEQDSGPGFDATVYSPTTDLKIKNDTPGHILIQTIFSPETPSLVFEIYGTSDGRVASITKPVILSQSAPPPDLFVDDPTIPAGQTKQIEHKAWGAKTTFSYKVERNGETLQDRVFISNYRSWQAVYLRGIGPAI